MSSESTEPDRVLTLLERHPKGLTIDEVSRSLPLNRSSAAKYLNILVAQGKAEMRRYGRAKVYSLCDRLPISHMLSLSSDLILIMDKDLVISQANNQLLAFFGLELKDISGKSYKFSPLAAYIDLDTESIQDVVLGGERTVDTDLSIKGEKYNFLVRMVPVIFESGEHGIALVFQDVTSLKRSHLELEALVKVRTRELTSAYERLQEEMEDHEKARIELSKSEMGFKSLLDAIQEGVWVFNREGLTTYVNPRMAEMLRYSTREIIGKHIFTFAGEDAIRFLREVLDQGSTGSLEQKEAEMIRSDGSKITTLVSLAPLVLPGDEFTGLVAGVVDISSRKHAEEIIRDTRDKLSSIIQSSPLAIIALDTDGIVTMWNPGAARLFGWNSSEVMGRRLPVVPGGSEEEYERFFSKALRGESIGGVQVKRLRKDGMSIDVELFNAPLHGGDGSIIGTFVIYNDISELTIINQTFVNANETINRVFNIVRNDLLSRIDQIQKKIGLLQNTSMTPIQDQQVKDIAGIAGLIEKTFYNTRIFHGVGENLPKWLSLTEVILESSSEIDFGTIRLDVILDDLEIYADLSIKAIFSCLLANTVRRDPSVSRIDIRYLKLNDHLSLYYEDDGNGIPIVEKERLFTPFHENHAFYFIKELLGVMNMTIRETGEPGHGTRFEIDIPRTIYRFP